MKYKCKGNSGLLGLLFLLLVIAVFFVFFQRDAALEKKQEDLLNKHIADLANSHCAKDIGDEFLINIEGDSVVVKRIDGGIIRERTGGVFSKDASVVISTCEEGLFNRSTGFYIDQKSLKSGQGFSSSVELGENDAHAEKKKL